MATVLVPRPPLSLTLLFWVSDQYHHVHNTCTKTPPLSHSPVLGFRSVPPCPQYLYQDPSCLSLSCSGFQISTTMSTVLVPRPLRSLTLLLFVATFYLSHSHDTTHYHDYIVVGAGPGGLQMAYFLKNAARDYIVLEKANISGIILAQFYLKHTTVCKI